MEIENKVVIVTGASSGIGLATAKLLTEKGAKVALVARSTNKLNKISAELPGSLAITTDMTDFEAVKTMIKQVKKYYGRIDILINNAGVGFDAPIEKTSIKNFRYVFDLDLLGPLVAMQEVIPFMREQGGGMIINISSGLALMYLQNTGAYSSMKRALGGISLTAREELKDDKIKVSIVYPFITLTDFEKNTIKEFVEEGGDSDYLARGDTAEYAAGKILDCINSEEPEVFAHDWMKK